MKLVDGIARGQGEDGAPALTVRKGGEGRAIPLNFCQRGPVRVADRLSKASVETDREAIVTCPP